LFHQLKPISLTVGTVLYEARAPIEYAYFPNSGALSAVVVMSDGNMIEVATVGPEGAVGLPILMTAESSPNRVLAQISGESMRIDAAVLRQIAAHDEEMRQLFVSYYNAFTFQCSQSVACNGLHSVQQRCCRWLLMSHDRIPGDDIFLTHEFLAVMLGVRRPSVTEVLQPLNEKGLVANGRGKITVLNRRGLEDEACECYRLVRDEYARMLN
jgi:CRP-like cAMP-binding protein